MKIKTLALMAFGLFASVHAYDFKVAMERTIAIPSGSPIDIPLVCEHNEGKVSYTIRGLPAGLSLSSNQIIGSLEASSGNFPILIEATDSTGNTASQIVVLTIENELGLSETSNTGLSSSSITTSALDNARRGTNSSNSR